MENEYKYNIHATRLIKVNGKLEHIKPKMKVLYENFVKSIQSNQIIDVFFEAHDGTGSNAQLKKIHACIREIAFEMGDSFSSSKDMVKSMSGLKFPQIDEKDYEKSFAICSSKELSVVIQTIIEIGRELGINFEAALPRYLEEDL